MELTLIDHSSRRREAPDAWLLDAVCQAGHPIAARREIRESNSAFAALNKLGFPSWAIEEIAASTSS